jgi:hypothetical protein
MLTAGAGVAAVVAAVCVAVALAKDKSPARTAPSPAPHAPPAAPGAPAAATGSAPEAKVPGRAPLHGGAVAATAEHRFETVLAPQGIFVYVYGANGAPAMVHKASGTASLRFPDGATKEIALAAEAPAPGEPAAYFCPMHADVVRDAPGVCEACGGMKLYTQDRLAGRVDGAGLGAKGVEASIRIRGLASKEREVAFRQALSPIGAAPQAGPVDAPPRAPAKDGSPRGG